MLENPYINWGLEADGYSIADRIDHLARTCEPVHYDSSRDLYYVIDAV